MNPRSRSQGTADRVFHIVVGVICLSIFAFLLVAGVVLLYLQLTGETIDPHIYSTGLHIGIPSAAVAFAFLQALRRRR